MHIDFHPLSMMDLRSKPGEVLDDVADRGRAFVIERNGQQKACLVPISMFLPDIQPSRLSKELDYLADENETIRISITKKREVQLLFKEIVGEEPIEVCITLPHGYPNKSPIVTADPIEPTSPHRWIDGSLCVYGAMETWNPEKHHIVNTLQLSRRWLASYLTWRKSDEWPINGSC